MFFCPSSCYLGFILIFKDSTFGSGWRGWQGLVLRKDRILFDNAWKKTRTEVDLWPFQVFTLCKGLNGSCSFSLSDTLYVTLNNGTKYNWYSVHNDWNIRVERGSIRAVTENEYLWNYKLCLLAVYYTGQALTLFFQHLICVWNLIFIWQPHRPAVHNFQHLLFHWLWSPGT